MSTLRKSKARLRWGAAVLSLALVAAACGDDRDDEEAAPETTAAADDGATETTAVPEGDDGTTETTEAPEAEGEMFGDIAWPCGPNEDGLELTDSDVGVTADTIKIGAGDDRGFATAPGLNKEQGDAMEAFVAKCNELGGINGRQVELTLYDAAITNVVNVVTQACQDGEFMLVGQGFSLDSLQEEVRLGCGLATVPAWSVSAAFAHAPLMIQPVPNPADRTPMTMADQLSQLYPDRIANAATVYANYAATIETKDKVLASYPEYGFNFLVNLEYNINGEDDWTPFVLQLKEAGAQIVYFTGSCLPNYQAFMQAARVNELDIITFSDTNFYTGNCAAANADGAMDGLHVRSAFIPFEEADVVPAVGQYLELLEGSGGETGILGMQTTSAFLLWATAAKDCGADLTRDCILETIAGYEEWTGGGMHAPTNPASNEPPDCGMLIQLVGTEYSRIAPEEPGTFDCDPAHNAEVQTTWVDQAQLDENRVSQLFIAALQE